MPTVDDVQFDTTGWELRETTENRVTWSNAAGDSLTKRFSPGAPKMPGLFRSQDLAAYYAEQVSNAGGAVLSVDLVHVKGTSVSRMLFKAPHSEGILGFVGSLTLAYRNFSFSIRIQAVERPGDEARAEHAMAFLKMSYPSDTDLRPLWFGESVPAEDTTLRRCQADDDVWDIEFPEHPLSRIRKEFARLLPTLQISRDVKNSVPHNT
ncbi:MAG: hypothetical protein JWM11_3752 [Planctomycetaceae bacterium]|nr:hypothetical protein [Planctomycetaceae bacterium]